MSNDEQSKKILIIELKIKHPTIYPEGQYVQITHEDNKPYIDDDKIYFYYSDDDFDHNELKIGDNIELDETFEILKINFLKTRKRKPQKLYTVWWTKRYEMKISAEDRDDAIYKAGMLVGDNGEEEYFDEDVPMDAELSEVEDGNC